MRAHSCHSHQTRKNAQKEPCIIENNAFTCFHKKLSLTLRYKCTNGMMGKRQTRFPFCPGNSMCQFNSPFRRNFPSAPRWDTGHATLNLHFTIDSLSASLPQLYNMTAGLFKRALYVCVPACMCVSVFLSAVCTSVHMCIWVKSRGGCWVILSFTIYHWFEIALIWTIYKLDEWPSVSDFSLSLPLQFWGY